MDDIIKMMKSVQGSGVSIDGVTWNSYRWNKKEQKGGFFVTL